MKRKGFASKLVSVVCASSLALAMIPVTAVSALAEEGAQAGESLSGLLAQGVDFSTANYSYVEGQLISADSEAALSTTTGKNDLRESGLVTSVKSQAPWGTCWAFGITAAAETSILSESTEATAETLDLSEHHLAWFAKTHIPSEGEEGYDELDDQVKTQGGEGAHYFTETGNARMESGMPYLGTSAYASGMGILPEYYAPYQGSAGTVTATKTDPVTKVVDTKDFASAEEAIAAGYTPDSYSTDDDWSLDESLRFGQSYALEESNILPDINVYSSDSSTWTGYNGNISAGENLGVNAIKSELDKGHAVTIAYTADSFSPNQATGNASRFINKSWSHYTWSDNCGSTGSDHRNHGVTIVGYDDNYSASNFTITNPVKWDSNENAVYQLTDKGAKLEYDASEKKPYMLNDEGEKIYFATDSKYIEGSGESYAIKSAYRELENDAHGSSLIPGTEEVLGDRNSLCEPVIDTETSYTPAGDGAWIVKNSWGSSANDFPNQGTFGNEGYFYLSYYDKSVSSAETFDFAVSDTEQSQYSYALCYEYDFMPVSLYLPLTLSAESYMANVFTADCDSLVKNVSAQTAKPETTVNFKVYRLSEDSDDPTDGTLVSEVTEKYAYAGYHRANLKTPVYLNEGERFAVVVTQTIAMADGTTQYVVNLGMNTNEAAAQAQGLEMYYEATVNSGESWVYTKDDGQAAAWSDLNGFIQEAVPSGITSAWAVDNFAIKAYGNPVSLDISATGASIEQGSASGDAVFVIGEDVEGLSLDNFDSAKGVTVDGVSITQGTHYRVETGSIKLTLFKSYLDSLSVGTHTVRLYLQSTGKLSLPSYVEMQVQVDVKTTPAAGSDQASASAKTGDATGLVMAVLGAIALCAIGAVVLSRRKSRKR